jgi:hypothetical protein|tara:strand:+ start:514 stop:651 length:138 start_codon:yes stop_codon:yes gene_type:complete
MIEVLDEILEIIYGSKPKPKRARDSKGRYKGDDKSTKDINEAWEL